MMLMMRTPLFFPTSLSSFTASAAARGGRPSTAPLSSPKRITSTRRTRLPTHPKHRFPPRQQPSETQPQQQPKQDQEEDEEKQCLQQQKHRDRAMESFHRKRRFNALVNKLQSKHGSDLIRTLSESDDGDLNKEEFWAVVRFLSHHSRFRDVILVMLGLLFLLDRFWCIYPPQKLFALPTQLSEPFDVGHSLDDPF